MYVCTHVLVEKLTSYFRSFRVFMKTGSALATHRLVEKKHRYFVESQRHQQRKGCAAYKGTTTR